jgi:hypothetical protein
LEDTHERLSSSYKTITVLEQRLKTTVKLVIFLAALLAVRLALMVLGFILYAKGVKIPRWMDILL